MRNILSTIIMLGAMPVAMAMPNKNSEEVMGIL
jgi:hypothetical protein